MLHLPLLTAYPLSRNSEAIMFGTCVILAILTAAQTDKPLVTRDRVQLNLAGAELILDAAKKKAAAMGLRVNVAVVDDGGHLLVFARMDGARPASGYTALTKAAAAGRLRLRITSGSPLAGAASGGKGTALKGGVPVVLNGQVIGAVGVGGGTGEQDVEVAKAGIAALLAELGAKK